MTRKHFKALAEQMRITKPDGILLEQWKRDVQAIAYVCHLSNLRFNSRKFFIACGLTD